MNNTWSVELIDYFHSLQQDLFKEGDTINFTKASCTLDNCIKVYSSRVDSIATETGRLLGGLDKNESKSKFNKKDQEVQKENIEEENNKNRKKKVNILTLIRLLKWNKL